MKLQTTALTFFGLLFTYCLSGSANATDLNLSDKPLLASTTASPLTLMVMGRNHKLYYEAYNDAADLNGDGLVDVGYKPATIDYYGYFGSYLCYTYDSTNNLFLPSSATADKTCSGGSEWSGDFLNYMTTARIDALRKVFYGGKRSIDSSSRTVLERTFIPQDAHSWGKEYKSIAIDGYDIRDYTPLALPVNGTRHLFANTTTTAGGDPFFRVLNDSAFRIWNWVSKERTVADTDCVSSGGSTISCTTAAASSWSIVPASSGATEAGLQNLVMTTFDTTAAGATYPNDHGEYTTFVTTYATSGNKLGSGSVSTINGSGNPFGSDDNYLTLFTGTLNIPVGEAGTYNFAVDGDDAVEVLIDGIIVAGYYGGHAECNCQTYDGSRVLTEGAHTVEFRHQEAGGGDNYFLYWEKAVPQSNMTDYVVRNQVCTSSSLKEPNCQLYPSGNYKPVGLLQEFGESDSMMFGLLTGSYAKNTSGGVLRKNIGTITDEINSSDGTFNGTSGIVDTIDKLTTIGFDYASHSYNQNCGWITTSAISEGQCRMWGNPVAEMMYEGLRYFAGKAGPTSDYSIAASSNDDATLGLPLPAWTDPYSTHSQCAKPFEIVISDINPSYDTDQLPGVNGNFGSFTGDLSGLDVESIADTISSNEPGISGSRFIGQVGATYDGAPTAKNVTSLGNIRGLAPEEPTKQGGYYSASVAHYGKTTDISATAAGDQFVDTFSVALASPLPRIEIPVNGSTVTLVPFAKSVSGGSPNIVPTKGSFQPTNTIVDFYVESITATSGKFRINYEDVEQGADHDMDAIVEYEYNVNVDNTVTIRLNSTYAAGGIIQHMGYVISGTTQDGIYLEVRDIDTGSGSDPDYFLDTPPGQTPGGVWADSAPLPLVASRTFTPSGGSSASLLQNPLWYAAKWGGYIESEADANNLPDQTSEWDDDANGDPDNYFLVTNALNLKSQLTNAFNEILARSGSASAAALSSGELNTDSMLYQSIFNTLSWTGELKAFGINDVTPSGPGDPPIGAISPTPTWVATDVLPAPGSRVIITHDGAANDGSNGTAFTWTASTPADLKTALDKTAGGTVDGNGAKRLDFLRGDQTNEGGLFRVRDGVLGDMVNSSPVFVGVPDFFYPDSWGASAPESAYSAYITSKKSRTPVVYIGGNDGMMHGFNADTGVELLAYVPKTVWNNLSQLSSSTYSHKFFADGSPTVVDAYFGNAWHTVLAAGLNKGGQGVYALDVSSPGSFTESDANLVLWEFTDADDADLGYTYSAPAIVRMHNGIWAAIIGNGYNNTTADGTASTTGNAVLYIVNVATGALIKKIDTGVGISNAASGGKPNGLASPAPVDTDGDGIVEVIYAGDLYGNMWKFDVSATNIASWDIAFKAAGKPAPLYVAKDASKNVQPITSAPDVGPGLLPGEVIVYFGTGKYIETSDNNTSGAQTQTFYGIMDRGAAITKARNLSLLEQTVRIPYTTTTCTNNEGISASCVLRVTSDNEYSKPPEAGWFIDLPDVGERSVASPILRGERIIFITLVPSGDQCDADGNGWLMELNAVDGRRLSASPFDINGDKAFTDQDYVNIGTDDDPEYVPVTGKKFLDGAPTGTPAVLTDTTHGKEYKYTQLSSGTTDTTVENPGDLGVGRQSWRVIVE